MERIDWVKLFLLGAIWGGSFTLLRITVPVFGALPTACLRVLFSGLLLTLIAVLSEKGLRLGGRFRTFFVIGVLHVAGRAASRRPSSGPTSCPTPTNKQDYGQYLGQVRQFSSIVVGPGMGNHPGAKKLIEVLLASYPGPVVLDADALNIIAEHKLHGLCMHRKGPTVLTPHPGEMARLLGWKKEEVIQDPVKALKTLVEITHSVVLLKGAATLLLSPDEVMYLNHFPNSGMATAGSGDVLAGMIGGLLAQGMSGFDAAQAGVYLHSLAGARAATRVSVRGMIASDIIKNIPHAYQELQKKYGEEESPRMAKLL